MTMKQQCHLWSVWLTWLALPAIALTSGLLQSWWAAAFVLVVGIGAQVAYVRYFPNLSRVLGYGSVEDEDGTHAEPTKTSGIHVILYTANTCPFCPLVRQRLQKLQRETGFELEVVDVTFRPQLVREKGLRSVPVIECGSRYHVGHATTAELSAFLAGPRLADA